MRVSVLVVVLGLTGCSAAAEQGSDDRPATTGTLAASPAVAKEQTTFTLCSQGSYASYAVFRDRSRTATVKAGACATTTFPPEHDSTHRADLYGVDPDSGTAFLIGTDWWGTDYDAKVRTTGTAMSPDWFGHD